MSASAHHDDVLLKGLRGEMDLVLSGKPDTHQIVRPSGDASVHLDALRAFAAFSVLLNHWRDATLIDYSKLNHHSPLIALGYFVTGLGHQWVIVFFVLSGYLVGGSVLGAFARDSWSWRAYLLTRLTRLLIVHTMSRPMHAAPRVRVQRAPR